MAFNIDNIDDSSLRDVDLLRVFDKLKNCNKKFLKNLDKQSFETCEKIIDYFTSKGVRINISDADLKNIECRIALNNFSAKSKHEASSTPNGEVARRAKSLYVKMHPRPSQESPLLDLPQDVQREIFSHLTRDESTPVLLTSEQLKRDFESTRAATNRLILDRVRELLPFIPPHFRDPIVGKVAKAEAAIGDINVALFTTEHMEKNSSKDDTYSWISLLRARKGKIQNAMETAKLITDPEKYDNALMIIIANQAKKDIEGAKETVESNPELYARAVELVKILAEHFEDGAQNELTQLYEQYASTLMVIKLLVQSGDSESAYKIVDSNNSKFFFYALVVILVTQIQKNINGAEETVKKIRDQKLAPESLITALLTNLMEFKISRKEEDATHRVVNLMPLKEMYDASRKIFDSFPRNRLVDMRGHQLKNLKKSFDKRYGKSTFGQFKDQIDNGELQTAKLTIESLSHDLKDTAYSMLAPKQANKDEVGNIKDALSSIDLINDHYIKASALLNLLWLPPTTNIYRPEPT